MKLYDTFSEGVLVAAVDHAVFCAATAQVRDALIDIGVSTPVQLFEGVEKYVDVCRLNAFGKVLCNVRAVVGCSRQHTIGGGSVDLWQKQDKMGFYNRRTIGWRFVRFGEAMRT